MLSYSDALEILLGAASPISPTKARLENSIGCVAACDVRAAAASPGFDNSAMDGYAIVASDTSPATAASPVRLTITASVSAGRTGALPRLRTGGAVEIMTGAPVPANTTTVIPIEMTTRDGDEVSIVAPYPDGRNIRRAGTDFAPGDIILRQGCRIGPAAIPALAAAGLDGILVHPMPRLFWISTGRELVDDPSVTLAHGEIYNSSGPFGAAMVPFAGSALVARQTISDDGESFWQALEIARSADVDVVISTGGVSVGRFDFVRDRLERMGAEILFHRVQVKPGKPVLFARLPDGRHFFGLPGNPVSTAMGFRMFVVPFLRALNGLPPERAIVARLAEDTYASQGLTVFLKGRLGVTPEGMAAVVPLIGQESFKVGSMTEMNCWIIHPEGAELLKAGAIVDCLPFAPDVLSLA